MFRRIVIVLGTVLQKGRLPNIEDIYLPVFIKDIEILDMEMVTGIFIQIVGISVNINIVEKVIPDTSKPNLKLHWKPY